jgi:hypothetical protein
MKRIATEFLRQARHWFDLAHSYHAQASTRSLTASDRVLQH